MNNGSGRHLSFPFRIEKDGVTAQVSSLNDHVRHELIQLILTSPYERVFLPDFGGGARALVFESSDPSTSGMAKAMITQAISRWLGNRISIDDLKVEIENERIDIYIKYKVLGEEEEDVSRELRFARGDR